MSNYLNAGEGYHVIHPSTYSFCVKIILWVFSNMTISWNGHCVVLALVVRSLVEVQASVGSNPSKKTEEGGPPDRSQRWLTRLRTRR